MIGVINMEQISSTQNVKMQVKMEEPVTTQQLGMGLQLVVGHHIYRHHTQVLNDHSIIIFPSFRAPSIVMLCTGTIKQSTFY